MPWYYFDIRSGEALYPDEEGLDLADHRAAETEAAHALAGVTKDAPESDARDRMAIEVRTKDGPVFHLSFVYPAKATKH